jgi:hypothetical protein
LDTFWTNHENDHYQNGDRGVEFFEHKQRMLAKMIDQKLPVPESSSISFEDQDLLELLRSDNLALFRAIKERPIPSLHLPCACSVSGMRCNGDS